MAGETQEGAQQVRFLLGGGSEADRERLEAEFFADDDAFQQMLTAEDDLIDAYARGELAASERRQFERRFLSSSEGRERVQFARAFAAATGPETVTPLAAVSTTTPPGFFASIFGRAPALRLAFPTIAVVAMIGFSWLLVERSQMNRELNALRAEHVRLSQQADELQRTADAEKLKNSETLAQLKDLQERLNVGPQPVPPAPNKAKKTIDEGATYAVDRRTEIPALENVVFEVNPGATRGGSGNTFTVAKNVKSITLRLGLESESSREEYRANVETAGGRRVKSVDFRVAAGNPHDRVTVPALSAKELSSGDYVIFLMAKQPDNRFEPVGSYSFRVLKK